MYWDLNDYLSDGLMTKVDRASMSKSLEVRCPFLDHDFIEYAWSIPVKYKVKGNTGKWILRKAFEDYLPKSIVWRQKEQFLSSLTPLQNTNL